MQEKRGSNRLSANEETFLSRNGGQQAKVKLIDISLGGMKVLMNEELETGTELSGKFNILPRIGPFYIKGKVIWNKPCKEKDQPYLFEIGVKFTKINTLPL